MKRFKINGVVHFAAETHVDRSLRDPHLFVETNVLGTSIVMATCVTNNVQRVIHVCTDEVYGDISFGSATEDSPTNPRTPYAASKASGSAMVKAYHATFGLNVSITRSANNYGPWQHPEKFIPKAVHLALNGQAIPLHGDGRHMRDWTWVDDNCWGIDMVLHKGAAGDIYNIGAGEVRNSRQIACLLLEILGLSPNQVEFVPDRMANDRRYLMNTTKMRSLGWAPAVDLREGLEATVAWYERNSNWTNALVEQLGVAEKEIARVI